MNRLPVSMGDDEILALANDHGWDDAWMAKKASKRQREQQVTAECQDIQTVLSALGVCVGGSQPVAGPVPNAPAHAEEVQPKPAPPRAPPAAQPPVAAPLQGNTNIVALATSPSIARPDREPPAAQALQAPPPPLMVSAPAPASGAAVVVLPKVPSEALDMVFAAQSKSAPTSRHQPPSPLQPDDGPAGGQLDEVTSQDQDASPEADSEDHMAPANDTGHTDGEEMIQVACPICLDTIHGPEMCTGLPCAHVVHTACLTRWTAVNPTLYRWRCPMRCHLTFRNEDELIQSEQPVADAAADAAADAVADAVADAGSESPSYI